MNVLIDVHLFFQSIFDLLNDFDVFFATLSILKSVDPDKVDELEVAGFICTTFSLNIIFFILTAFKIRQVKKEMYAMTAQENSSRHQAKFNTAEGK